MGRDEWKGGRMEGKGAFAPRPCLFWIFLCGCLGKGFLLLTHGDCGGVLV